MAAEQQKHRVRNLVSQFGLKDAAAAALLSSVAHDLCKSPRLHVVGEARPANRQGGKPDTIRQRRSRAAKKAGLRAVRGTFYVNDNTLSALVREQIIPLEATERDLDLLDTISELLDRLAWSK